jgi:hypothetical protein
VSSRKVAEQEAAKTEEVERVDRPKPLLESYITPGSGTVISPSRGRDMVGPRLQCSNRASRAGQH